MKTIFLAGSCRLYNSFDKSNKILVNPTGHCMSMVEIKQGLELANGDSDLIFTKEEKEKLFKVAPQHYPDNLLNININLNNIDTFIFEPSSFKTVKTINKNNQTFYTYTNAQGYSDLAVNFGTLIENIDIQTSIMDEILEKYIKNSKIIIFLIHNLDNIPKREKLRNLWKTWCNENKIQYLDVMDILPNNPRNILKDPIRYSENFYKVINQHFLKII